MIEGVMMRTPHGVAIAVRQPDGGLVVRDRPWRSWTKRFSPLGWPFVRGVVVLVESLREGIDGLRFSAEVAIGEEAGTGDKGRAPQPSRASRFSANLSLVLGLILALTLFKGVPHGLSLWLGLDPTHTLFHVVDGAIKLVLVIGYITAISRMKDIQRVFQYHGAEHKSIRAFEERAELTVGETIPFSRLHERCGTSFLVVVVLASMVVYIAASPLIPRNTEGGLLFQLALIGAKILLLGPVSSIAYEINRWAGTHWRSPLAKVVAWPGLLMQRLLTTREPSPDQLEVALASLRTALVFTQDDAAKQGNSADWRVRRFEDFASFNRELDEARSLEPGHPEAA